MLDSAGRCFRNQGQVLGLCGAEKQKTWGRHVPFSPPGTTCLLLISMLSSSHKGESSSRGQVDSSSLLLFWGSQKFTPQMVRNSLLSSFSLFLATFIFLPSGMKHFYFSLNSSSPSGILLSSTSA